MKKLKIALVHEMLVKMGGAERVLNSLQKLFPESPIYTLAYDKKKCGEIFPKEKIRTSRLQKFLDWGIPRQLLVSKMPRAIEDFDFSEFNLVISSSSAFAHGIITPSTVPHICYVHAPMRYVWDYTHEYLEEKTQGWKKIFRYPLFSLLHHLRIWDYTAGTRPDILLANSCTTQKRIQKFWRRDAEVVYPPVDTKKFSEKKTLRPEHFPADYYCIVSALEPFKKIDIVVEAFAHQKFSRKNLVIIGDGSDFSRIKEIAKNTSNIQFLGRKSDHEVLKYIQHCKALVFPGLEDFGITPVEAMSAGKPVIFYRAGGVAESVIDFDVEKKEGTGIGFNQQTPEKISEAIEKFETKEIQEFFSTQEQIKKIKKRAENFSEEIFEKKILKNIEEIMNISFKEFL